MYLLLTWALRSPRSGAAPFKTEATQRGGDEVNPKEPQLWSGTGLVECCVALSSLVNLSEPLFSSAE